ncbi:MAG: SIMPL domain-containing protein [Chloroflexi bacterium]|nr:SIMPL domain-containing protein [Chloroflexota bacterium]
MQNRIILAIAVLALLIGAILVAYLAASPRVAPIALNAATSAQSVTADAGVFVSGTGRVRAKPDIAQASIGVEVTTATLADATAQANQKASALIERIKSFGVADNDIQTTQYSVQPITSQPRTGETPTITGYRVSNTLQVTIRKIADAGKILDAAVVAGANKIYGVSFSIGDPTPYQQQARAAAVKDATEKAKQLAQAATVQLGKVLSISETSASPRPVFRTALAAEAASAPLETGELEISVSVEMKFAAP